MAKKKAIAEPAVETEAAAVWVERSALHAWDKNPRNNKDAIKPVMESIKRFGFGAPILARKNGEVIAGHTRLLAAEALGLDRVPVRYLDLDPAEAHLLALADNKLNEKAEWDDALLLETMGEYDLEDLEIAGWLQKDIDELGDGFLEADKELVVDYSAKHQVLVLTTDENSQASLYERLSKEGFECQLLTL